MEKNTVLAIVLSSLILVGGLTLQNYLNERNAPEPGTAPEAVETEPVESAPETPETVVDAGEDSDDVETVRAVLTEQDFPVTTIVEKTDKYRIEFSTAGGIVTGILLLQEFDNEGQPIPMVLGDGTVGAFNIGFGGAGADYIVNPFSHERIVRGGEIQHRFARDFVEDDQVFTLVKNYRIIPGEYVIELTIGLETPDGRAVPLGSSAEPAYTLTYGPQIGPTFKKLDARNEVREYVTWGPTKRSGDDTREVHRNRGNFVEFDKTISWAGVVGKYFGVLVSPSSGSTRITWDGRPADGMEEPSRLQITRPARQSANIIDTYNFYIGPLSVSNLERYENADSNAFGLSDMNYIRAPRTSAWLGWLEAILKVLLELFYRLIPNYGVAIILLTVLIKVILFPFTHNSYESTAKMQAVQPKLKELQEKYRDEPQKLQQKQAELYKAEGVNPMGGCLPMLFQMPIFIALYGLLNKYFPLRGAVFIPGWIDDLSGPEAIVQFENGINLLGNTYDAIRLLPVLYLGGQLLMTKVTQQGTGGQTGAQQKMLTLGMPIMFFFILYNMPSGLLLYWTAMNFITIGQQLVTNRIKKRNAAGGAA